MAHNIQILSDGTECFVENGKKQRAWHGLGQVYDRPLSALEALKGCHADWNVDSRNIYYPSQEWGKILMENKPMTPQEMMQYFSAINEKRANVRSDNNFALGIVGKDYGIVQNTEAFDFIDMLTSGKIGGEVPTIETAGVLGNGERIFITAKLPEPIRIANNSEDLVDMYFVFTTSHDGSGAVNCMCTPIRVVCNNTLSMAFKQNSGKLSFRHTVNIGKRLDLTNKESAERAFKCMNLYNTYKKYFEESLEQLAKIQVNDAQIEKLLVNSLLTPEVQKIYAESGNSLNCEDIPTRSKNIIMGVTESLHGGVGQDILTKGNGLWLVNGLTTYYQNEYDWKGDDERKFDAIMGGSVNTKLQNLYANLLKVA